MLDEEGQTTQWLKRKRTKSQRSTKYYSIVFLIKNKSNKFDNNITVQSRFLDTEFF
jgi:hypothetical protein